MAATFRLRVGQVSIPAISAWCLDPWLPNLYTGRVFLEMIYLNLISARDTCPLEE
jgi:hypothetical protein